MQRPGGASGGGSEPYFFLSYAHTPPSDSRSGDPDLLVDRFFEDLCADVMQMTDLPRGAAAGFMDRRLTPGEGWPASLSDALSRCRVFVPLYSPRYFSSEQCGKEWFFFSRRTAYHRAAGARRMEGMVPALWVPVPPESLPGPAESLQFSQADLGPDYASEGLYGLSRLGYLHSDYERVVYHLAKRIVTVAHETRIPPGRRADYRDVPSAFEPADGVQELRVVVLAGSRRDRTGARCADCYGPSPVDWNPYHPHSKRALADHVADLARSLDYRVRVGAFEDEAERMLAPGPPAGPELLLVDRWALTDPRHRGLLQRLDAVPRPWISIMLPWNRDHAGAARREEELQAATEEALHRKLHEGPTSYRLTRTLLPNLDVFYDDLPTAVRRASQQYLRHAVTHPPEGEPVRLPRLMGPLAPGVPDPPPGRGPGRPDGPSDPQPGHRPDDDYTDIGGGAA
ncbi:TIR-like protein FxsC [Streptomyces sp. NPDC001380]|uniref:TIR-like protein FxsC n=1 Tax=Streptomyces sp. NPDC001380 TaxID=3364566 RepID=UPI0036741C35